MAGTVYVYRITWYSNRNVNVEKKFEKFIWVRETDS